MTDEEKFREFQKLISEIYKDDGEWVWVTGLVANQCPIKDKNLRRWLRKRAKELRGKYIG